MEVFYTARSGSFHFSSSTNKPPLCSLPTQIHKPEQDFKAVPPIDFNDKLRLASSWFGMCGISSQVSPIQPDSGGGIQLMQADTFDLHSFHTLTGTTFMAVTERQTTEAAEVLKGTYVIIYGWIVIMMG
jgi:Sybindin-like family